MESVKENDIMYNTQFGFIFDINILCYNAIEFQKSYIIYISICNQHLHGISGTGTINI